MSGQFLKIPGSLIHNIELGDKRVIAYCSIILSEWSGVNYEELAAYSLYSGFRGGGNRASSQYKELVDSYYTLGYFEKADGGIINIDTKERFSIIYTSEIEQIFELRRKYKEQGLRLNHANLLLLLAHIRLYMNYEGRKYYSDYLARISQKIGLSVRSISSALKILEELEIIHNQELPRYEDENGWHSNVRIFVDMKQGGSEPYRWDLEVARGAREIYSKRISSTHNTNAE